MKIHEQTDVASRGEMKRKAVTYGGALTLSLFCREAQDVHRNNPRFIVRKMRPVLDF